MDVAELTIYYDGDCVICRNEVARLRHWDRAGRLAYADITAPDFLPPAGADLRALNTEMHALTGDGRLVVGIDSLVTAYTLVGRGWMVAPLRVRLLRPMFAALYRGFARNRYRISSLLHGAACADGVCANKRPLV